MADITIKDILLSGRRLLLDPDIAPSVTSPVIDQASDRLTEVRIAGMADEVNGEEGVGTVGWNVLKVSSMPPYAVLSARNKRATYKETGRVWEDWDGYLHGVLGTQIENDWDLASWAMDWEAALQDWFPTQYRIGLAAAAIGDLYWKYVSCDFARYVISGVTVYGFIARLQIHNTRLVTWRAGQPGT